MSAPTIIALDPDLFFGPRAENECTATNPATLQWFGSGPHFQSVDPRSEHPDPTLQKIKEDCGSDYSLNIQIQNSSRTDESYNKDFLQQFNNLIFDY